MNNIISLADWQRDHPPIRHHLEWRCQMYLTIFGWVWWPVIVDVWK
ncbi:MAG: hypothetical protein PHZ23_14165 [Acidiphilium sp.]|nr:hypothetical protein [Acidiphilium sp.]